METEERTPSYLQRQAWDYFQLHSGQRLTTFNFFIAIATVITTAIATTFSKEYEMPITGICLGLLLIGFCYIFWKLDDRNRQLIKLAERALIHFEGSVALSDSEDGGPHAARLFTRESYETDRLRRESRSLLSRTFSYTECFRLVLLFFGLLGILGVVTSAGRMLASRQEPPAQAAPAQATPAGKMTPPRGAAAVRR